MLHIPRWKDGLLWIFGILLLAAFLGVFAPKDEVRAQVGPPNQVLCNNVPQQPVADVTTGTTVKLITEVVGKTPFVCGWHVTATAASTFKFSYGTGANCVTGNVQFTPTFNVSTNAPSQDHIEFADISVPIGNAVCVTVAGTGPAQVMLWFGLY
jgi:hypothetical protein